MRPPGRKQRGGVPGLALHPAFRTPVTGHACLVLCLDAFVPGWEKAEMLW